MIRLLVEEGGDVIVARMTKGSEGLRFRAVVRGGLGVVVGSSEVSNPPEPIYLDWTE